MPPLPDRLALLRRTPRSWRVGALAESLRVCGPGEAPRIAADLIELAVPVRAAGGWFARWLRKGEAPIGEEAGLGVLRAWRALTSELRRDAIACLDFALPSLVGALGHSGVTSDRAAAMAVACDWIGPVSIELAGRLLFDKDEEVGAGAEEALLAATKQMGSLTPDAIDAIDSALAAAGQRYADHRRRGVMFGVLRGAQAPGPNLGRWLLENDHPGHLALRAALRQSTDSASRGRSVRWLTLPALAPAALERLQRPASEAELEASLALGHLLLRPERAARLLRAARPMDLVPSGAVVRKLSDRARRELPRWITLALPPAARPVRLVEFLSDPDPVARHGAVRMLDAIERLPGASAVAVAGLTDFAFDRDERVARRSSIALCAAPAPVRRLAGDAWVKLRRSPHTAVRRLAIAPSLETESLDAVIHGPGEVARIGAALRLRMAKERPAVVGALRRGIGAGGGADRVRTISIVRRLGLAPDCELELLGAAAGACPLSAAAAVSALGAAGTVASREAVARCMDHTDQRVRANAIEEVARRAPDHGRIIEAVRDPAARARANAVRARLLADTGREADALLAAMLTDERPDHRVSALWAAERSGRHGVAERVAQMARSAEDPRERAWAVRCARRLLGEMRLAWSSPAADAHERGMM